MLDRSDKVAIAARDLWTCQAAGLHHADCPGRATDETADQFVPHHRYTRERGKRERTPIELVDQWSNLILVWNGPTGLGAGGCHGRIHTEQRRAHGLGLLTSVLDT